MMVGSAVLAAAAIAFATLCPIQMRPHLLGADAERFAAYLALGALVSRASGRHWLGATTIVVIVALGLEAAQRLVPGRDAAWADAVVKALGGVFGSGAAQLVFPVRRLFTRLAAVRRLASG
jgi:VanZ family protein